MSLTRFLNLPQIARTTVGTTKKAQAKSNAMDRCFITSKALRARLTSVLTLLIVLSNGGNLAKTAGILDADPVVAASFTDKPFILPTDEITFTLNRLLAPNEGRVAVIIGSIDISSLL